MQAVAADVTLRVVCLAKLIKTLLLTHRGPRPI